jgi:fused signal recognition particle receptor
VQKGLKRGELQEPEKVRDFIKQEIFRMLKSGEKPLMIDFSQTKPFLLMVVGVNGVGKTTTIAKIAHHYSSQGKKVLIGAADTFRAAAVEQLEVWANRVGADLIKQSKGSDPSAVAFDAIHAALARNTDLVFIDTAGRLHTKVNLMEELKKVKRIIARECAGAPHEILLVLDATTGQNAISQAKLFNEAIGVTGIALTKLDGTAKGGIIIGITEELNIPIRYIGVGEGMDDLREFNASEFVQALF